MPKNLKQHYGMLLISEYAWEDEYQEWLREEAEKKAAQKAESAGKENDRISKDPPAPKAHNKPA